ncbi:hypothetical protein HPULCUR_010345 [Helicostylum pulchrum]|uniref:Uncharacterized protein n=1 Tax=Helicostylum pulchrum TaxID=562976 RepID=A0ABP9YCZ3_9FUNG
MSHIFFLFHYNPDSPYPESPIDKIDTVGYVQTGLFCQALCVDKPSTYVTRVTRFEPCVIASEVSFFGYPVTRALCMGIIREIILSVQKFKRRISML